MTTMRRTGWMIAAVALVFVAATPATAQDVEDGEQPGIDELRQELQQIEEDTADDVATEEFEQAYQWLDEAEELQQQGSRRGAEFRIRRANLMVDRVRALARLEDLEQAIEDRREAAENARQQLERRREEIESLEAQVEDRQEELERIQSEIE